MVAGLLSGRGLQNFSLVGLGVPNADDLHRDQRREECNAVPSLLRLLKIKFPFRIHIQLISLFYHFLKQDNEHHHTSTGQTLNQGLFML
jgi:hypothetical protein